jgi:RNA polymerase sigma-70 factor (ECF subfamily)
MEALSGGKVAWAGAEGGRELVSYLYDRYRQALYAFLLRLSGNPSLAEDLVQETFLRALEKVPRGAGDHPRAWIFRVARNLLYDHLRRAKREEASLEEEVRLGQSFEPPDSLGVQRVLKRLPPQYREILLLREVEGMSYEEISRAMGLSLSHVKVLLHRARRSLASLYLGEALARRRGFTCRSLELILSSSLDGQASSRELGRLGRHLEECSLCREEERRLRLAGELLALLPPVALPPSLASPLLPSLPARLSGRGEGSGGPATSGAASPGGAFFGGAVVASVLSAVVTLSAYGTLTFGRPLLERVQTAFASTGQRAEVPAGLSLTLGRLPRDLEVSLSPAESQLLLPAVPLFLGGTVRNLADAPREVEMRLEGRGEAFRCAGAPPGCAGGPVRLRLWVDGLPREWGESRVRITLPPGEELAFWVEAFLPPQGAAAYGNKKGTVRLSISR